MMSLTIRRRLLTMSLAALGALPLGGSPAFADRPPVDYGASFSTKFPLSGDAHQITDWALYKALATGDLVGYAARLDPVIAAQTDETKGRPYQAQQLESRIKQDRRLASAFEQQRQRLTSMLVSVVGGGVDGQTCTLSFVYIANEFRLLLGHGLERGFPLSHATIAPGCPETLNVGFQITAGRSPRFICWSDDSISCGWRLPDMPVALKSVIESSYPTKMSLRWRWRGLGPSVRTRYLDANGNPVGSKASAILTVPIDLELEFVGEGGHVLWVAPATALPVQRASLER